MGEGLAVTQGIGTEGLATEEMATEDVEMDRGCWTETEVSESDNKGRDAQKSLRSGLESPVILV